MPSIPARIFGQEFEDPAIRFVGQDRSFLFRFPNAVGVSVQDNLKTFVTFAGSTAIYCKRFALPASAQPSLREGSGTPKSSVGKVRPNPTESL